MLDARTTQDLTGASSPERSDVLCDVVVWRQSFWRTRSRAACGKSSKVPIFVVVGMDPLTPSRRSRRLSGLAAEPVTLEAAPTTRRSARKAPVDKENVPASKAASKAATPKKNAPAAPATRKSAKKAEKDEGVKATPKKNAAATPKKNAVEADAPKRVTRSALKNAKKEAPPTVTFAEAPAPSKAKEAPPTVTFAEAPAPSKAKEAPSAAKKNVTFAVAEGAAASDAAPAAPSSPWSTLFAVVAVAVVAIVAGFYAGGGIFVSLPTSPATAAATGAGAGREGRLAELISMAQITRINLEVAAEA